MLGGDAGVAQCGGTLQHRNVAGEIAFTRGGKNLFRTVARFENLDLATQHNREAEVSLPRFENHLATRYDASFSQWLEQSNLAVIQFRKGDTFRVAIELFVFLFVRHDFIAFR